MINHMIVYSLLIVACLIMHFFVKEKRNIFFIIMVTVFTLVSALRFNVGTDYQHYGDIFSWIQDDLDVYVEIGYEYLNVFIQDILHLDVRSLYIITSLITIPLFGYAIKKNVEERYWFLALFMFICSGIYFSSFNLIRQYIGIAMIAAATSLLINKKYFYYILVVALASTFHTSAWIMLGFVLLLLICRSNPRFTFIWIIYIFSLLFLVIDIRSVLNLLEPMIPERWVWYLNSDFLLEKNYLAVLKQIVPNIIMGLLLFKRKELIKLNPRNDIYILGLLICMMLTNAFFGVMVLVRLANYFDIYLVFCAPLLIQAWKDKINYKLIYLALIGYYIILTVVTIFIMGGYGVMPYQTIFNIG